MDDDQVAPVAPAPSEANQPMPQEDGATPQSQPKPQEYNITLSEDEYKFWQANGGKEKLMPQLKQWVGNPDTRPQPQEQAQPQPAPAPDPAQQVEQVRQEQMPRPEQPQPFKPKKGFLSPQEIIVQQYFNALSNQQEYSTIAEDIRSGKVLNEMSQLGINPFDQNGYVNDTQVNRFLQMYAKTRPAATPATPEVGNSAPDYYKTPDGKITTDEQARAVYAQKGHPQHAEAVEFMRQKLAISKPKTDKA